MIYLLIGIGGPLLLMTYLRWITKYMPDDPEMAALKELDGILPKPQPGQADYAKINRLERELGIGEYSSPEIIASPPLDEAARRALTLGMEPLPYVAPEHPRSVMGCQCDDCRTPSQDEKRIH